MPPPPSPGGNLTRRKSSTNDLRSDNYFNVRKLQRTTTIASGIQEEDLSCGNRSALWIGDMLNHNVTLIFITILIITDLIVFILAVTEEISDSFNHALSLTIISIFMFELTLRVLVFHKIFFGDYWSVLDGIIILTSFVMEVAFASIVYGDLVLILRFIRVVRIALQFMMRGGDITARLQNDAATPLESIVAQLVKIIHSGRLTAEQVMDLNNVIQLLLKEELYDPRTLTVAAHDEDDIELTEFLKKYTRPQNAVSLDRQASISQGTTIQRQKMHSQAFIDAAGDVKHMENDISAWERAEMERQKHDKDADPMLTWKGPIKNMGYELMSDAKVQQLLRQTNQWDFCVFDLEVVSGGNALMLIGYYFFFHFNLFREFNIPQASLKTLLHRIQVGYKASNPYHNATHGADVLQTLKWLLMDGGVYEKCNFAPIDLITCFLSAAAHDYGHQGVTNKFMQETHHPWAMTWNDTSVSENYHASALFRMLRDPTCNILASLTREQQQVVRSNALVMVVGTDMAKHFEDLSKFKATLLANEGEIKADTPAEKLAILKMSLHACDISAQTKNLEMAKVWGARCIKEFYEQGDREKKLKMTVSPMFDRDNSDVGKCQRGFIEYIVAPLWEAYCPAMLRKDATAVILKNLRDNKEFWGSVKPGVWDGPLDYVHENASDSSSGVNEVHLHVNVGVFKTPDQSPAPTPTNANT